MPQVRLHGVHSDHPVRTHGTAVVVVVSVTTENNIKTFQSKVEASQSYHNLSKRKLQREDFSHLHWVLYESWWHSMLLEI